MANLKANKNLLTANCNVVPVDTILISIGPGGALFQTSEEGVKLNIEEMEQISNFLMDAVISHKLKMQQIKELNKDE